MYPDHATNVRKASLFAGAPVPISKRPSPLMLSHAISCALLRTPVRSHALMCAQDTLRVYVVVEERIRKVHE